MIFRQSVLDRMSSPEELDELLRVTSPRTWLALVGLALLLLAGLIWSTVTVLTTTVAAQGVVAPSAREALVFLTPRQVGEVHIGMAASVRLPAAMNGASVSVPGRVITIGQAPLGLPALTLQTGSVSSASLLASNGSSIPVRVVFHTFPRVSGSTATRTPCQATITVSSQRLIHLIVP